MVITPVIAKEFLKSNSKNRTVRKAVVQSLIGVIERGAWMLTHQGIAFDTNGVLLDGQHRLLAIISADTSVEMYVTTGVSPDTFKVIDGVTPRRLTDRFEDDRRVVETMRLAIEISTGGVKVTPDVYEQYVNGTLHQCLNMMINHTGSLRKIFTAGGMRLAAALRICEQENFFAVMTQYRALVSDDYDAMSSHSKTFYKRAINNQLMNHSGSSQINAIVNGMRLFDMSKSSGVIWRINNEDRESLYAKARDMCVKFL
jgi:hypothetical protein